MSKTCMTLSSITVMFSGSSLWKATESSTSSMDGQASWTMPSIGRGAGGDRVDDGVADVAPAGLDGLGHGGLVAVPELAERPLVEGRVPVHEGERC